jgi:hypothetical protein
MQKMKNIFAVLILLSLLVSILGFLFLTFSWILPFFIYRFYVCLILIVVLLGVFSFISVKLKFGPVSLLLGIFPVILLIIALFQSSEYGNRLTLFRDEIVNSFIISEIPLGDDSRDTGYQAVIEIIDEKPQMFEKSYYPQRLALMVSFEGKEIMRFDTRLISLNDAAAILGFRSKQDDIFQKTSDNQFTVSDKAFLGFLRNATYVKTNK